MFSTARANLPAPPSAPAPACPPERCAAPGRRWKKPCAQAPRQGRRADNERRTRPRRRPPRRSPRPARAACAPGSDRSHRRRVHRPRPWGSPPCGARSPAPRAVLVTSLHTVETPKDAVDVLACDANGRFLVRTPLLPVAVNGAGDAAAALFFFHYLRGGLAEALARTVSSIFGLVRRTAQAGTRELLLIEAQEELLAPSKNFRPEPV